MRNLKIKNSKPMKLVMITLTLILSLAVIATGCTVKKVEVNEPVVNEPANTNVIEDFNELLKGDVKPADIIDFLDENISKATKEEASQIIDQLEKSQKAYQVTLQSKFENQKLQEEFINLYLAKGDINNPESMKSDELKALVGETKDNGFIVETAEGMFFPIIDYNAYKKYTENVTADMKDYIEIMAVESDKVPAKDGALVIGWDEIVERALKQEAFIKNHPNSSKLSEIKELYNKYVLFTLYGLNNTPLFDYESNTMNKEAKAAYTSIDLSDAGSEYKQMLKGYLELLEKSGYRLTSEIEKYRDNFMKKQ